jgi:hypothetical protein
VAGLGEEVAPKHVRPPPQVQPLVSGQVSEVPRRFG